MNDDQITDLARLLPAESAPDLPADRLQILKEHLMVEYRLAADPRPRPQRPRVRRRLLRVHVHQERRRLHRLQQRKPDRDDAAAARASGLAAGAQHLRLGPGDRTRQRTSLAEPPTSNPNYTCGEGSIGNPTYRLLQSLPTDPRVLLNLIDSYIQKTGQGQAVGLDGEAFVTIGDLIRETIVPPATAAALYRAAALIPGVTFIGHVTNIAGRPGVAIAWTNSNDRYEWIFDPATLQYVGERDFDMSTGKPVLNGNDAVMRRAFVGKAGQLP